MFKRILIVASCVALLVCVVVLPASAASLDYNDYITNVSVDGENDIVTVEFPVEANTHYSLFELVNGSYSKVREGVGSGSIYYIYPGHVYAFQFIPLFGNEISLADIPDGTKVSVDVDFSFDSDRAFNTPYLTNLVRYNGNGGEVGSQVFTYEPQAPNWMFPADFVVSKPTGATNFTCTFAINEFSFAVGGDMALSVSLYVKSYSMTMTISSLLRLQQESGRTNKILAAVEKQLAENGHTLDEVLQQQQQTNDKLDDANNKLDDIINGTVSPTTPNGSDIIGDLDDAEGQIRDDAQSGLDQGASVQQSAIQVLGQYLSAFACVSWIFDRFSTIPFVSGLLALSFSLGITGAILGIGLSIARSYSESSRSSRSARSKGG